MNLGFLDELMHQPFWAYYVSVALIMAPTVRIFMRAGFKPYFALLLLIPKVGYIFCAAALALQRWPVLPLQAKKEKKA